jgi:hypothetical protein
VEYLHPLVFKIVRAHLPRRVDEEDLAQEVFMRFFSRQGSISGTGSFRALGFPNCSQHLHRCASLSKTAPGVALGGFFRGTSRCSGRSHFKRNRHRNLPGNRFP